MPPASELPGNEPQAPRPLDEFHPTATIGSHPVRLLKGKRVALGLTGSIASIKGVELARELARHGAEVVALMSEPAMEFATGRPPITEIKGQVEHVTLARGGCQLYLIAPCTATTISRIALGLGDTPVALTAMALLGTGRERLGSDPSPDAPMDPHLYRDLNGVPVVIAPSMDGSMAANPAVKENLLLVKTLGCHVIPSRQHEGKAKLASVETIVAHALRYGGSRDWVGSRVLVVAGASCEPIDGVRAITNRSSGRTGIELAKALFARGAEVELWYGQSPTSIPEYLNAQRFDSVNEVMALAETAKRSQETGTRAHVDDVDKTEGHRWDWAFVPAALADFVVDEPFANKIASDSNPLSLDLLPAPRLLEALRPLTGQLVGFKLEVGLTRKELVNRAQARLTPIGPCDYMVANLAARALGGETTEVLVVGGPQDAVLAELSGSKMAMAHGLLETLGGRK